MSKTAEIDDMKTGTLIPINRPDRLLEKTRGYLTDIDAFLSDTPVSVTVLLDALPHAEAGLVLKMLPLLGYAGKDRALWPLYHLMLEPSKDQQVRRLAAVQLSLAASLSNDPSALKIELIKKLSHPNPFIRSNCALSLGWEGNVSAVNALLAHMADPDWNVQAAVVAALSSVGGVRVFDLLVARLETGTVEEQRSILLNLWRFAETIPRAEEVYLACLETFPTDLRLDALSGLAMVPLSTTILTSYQRLLVDKNLQIRRKVLENLSAEDPVAYGLLKDNLIVLLADQDSQIRQAAIRLLAMR